MPSDIDIYMKPQIVDMYTGSGIHHFPPSNKFPRNFGTWVLTTSKGKTVEKDSLEDLESYPGRFVHNTHHEFGYKYNILQDRWMPWDFGNNTNL